MGRPLGWPDPARLGRRPRPAGCPGGSPLPADPFLFTKGHAFVVPGGYVGHPRLLAGGVNDEEFRAVWRDWIRSPGVFGWFRTSGPMATASVPLPADEPMYAWAVDPSLG